MKFKDKLKQLRIQNGLTRRELAELTGISIRTVEGYEQGLREPKQKTINSLADVLEISPDELIVCTKNFKKWNLTNMLEIHITPEDYLELIDRLEKQFDWRAGVLTHKTLFKRMTNNSCHEYLKASVKRQLDEI